MKTRILLFGLVVVLATTMVSAQTITSNGTGGGDWNTGATWIGGVVPIVSDNVVIQGGDVVTLGAAGNCAILTMNANSSLSINASGVSIPGSSWNLDVTSTVTFNGPTTIQTGPAYGNLIYATSSTGGISTTTPANLTINGNFTISASTFRGISTTSGSVTHTVVGNVVIGPGTSARLSTVNNSSSTSASCTWNIGGNVTMTGNNAGNRIILQESAGPHTGTTEININGDLTIGTSSQIQYRSSTNANSGSSSGIVNVKGNVTVNGIISTATGGTGYNQAFNLTGTSAQQYSGSFPNSFGAGQTMTVNINGAGVTLNNAVTVNSNVTLSMVSGILTTTNTNLVTVSSVGAVAGGSSSSFVNGPLAQTWATATATKTYPLGKGTAYRPLEISLTTPTSPVIRAEVFNSNAGGTSALDAISTNRYYETSLVSGTATSGGTVKIAYGADDGVTTSGNLVVAQSSTVNGAYATLGSSATDGSSVTSGTSYNPASGDYLILGSTGGNALPVELISFVASAKGNTIELVWNTATELNNAGFEIQRSVISNQISEKAWSKIGFVEGNGTTNAPRSYRFSDNNFRAGKYQYRLKQIDSDGNFTYSNVVEALIVLTAQDYSLTQNYPNPFNPTTTFSFAMKHAELTTVKVYNLVGQEVATLFNAVAQPDQLYSLTFEAKNLPSGIYFYALRSDSRNEVKKMSLIK
jgi:hypothetical protein